MFYNSGFKDIQQIIDLNWIVYRWNAKQYLSVVKQKRYQETRVDDKSILRSFLVSNIQNESSKV